MDVLSQFNVNILTGFLSLFLNKGATQLLII